MSGKKPLPDGEAIKRSLANLRLAASTSFTEEEIEGLDSLLSTLRRGGDARLIARSPAMVNVSRKVLNMKATLERQRARRALKASSSTTDAGDVVNEHGEIQGEEG